MKYCPKCRTKQLVEAVAKKYRVTLDYCPACKGIWFDRRELEVLLNTPSEVMRMPLRSTRSPLICPTCRVPMRLFFFRRTLVGVEMCPRCKGLWLACGEFKEIASVVRHLRGSGVAPARPPEPASPGEPHEPPGPGGLKAYLLNLVNDTISSLSGW